MQTRSFIEQKKLRSYTESIRALLDSGQMTGGFLSNALLEIKGFTMLLISCTPSLTSLPLPIQLAIISTLESLQVSKEMISTGNLSTWNPTIQTLQSLKTSLQDSTSEGKAFLNFLNSLRKERLSEWWSPRKTDCVVLDSISLNGSLDSTLLNSWFSIRQISPRNKSSLKTSLPSSKCLLVDGMESESTSLRTRKVRLKLTSPQEKMLTTWSHHYRYTYNKAMNLAEETKKYNKHTLRNLTVPKKVNKHIPWILETPKDVRASAVFDAVANLKSCFSNLKNKNITHFTIPYKSKRCPSWSIGVPKSAIKKVGKKTVSIYSTYTKSEFKTTEEVPPIEHDCKIHFNGVHYYLLVPLTKKIKKPGNVTRECAIDPGSRAFLTLYDPENGCIEIGNNANKVFNKICSRIDRLYSLKAKSSRKKDKKRIEMKIRKWRLRIQNLRDELHHKASNFLCKNYSKICLPRLDTCRMSRKTPNRKLSSKSVRKMLTLSHPKFFDMTKTKCIDYERVLIEAREEYTTQTCSVCGSSNKIGSSKIYHCRSCLSVLDRDMNASKNIFVKNLYSEIKPLCTLSLKRVCNAFLQNC
jgi:putative transposase